MKTFSKSVNAELQAMTPEKIQHDASRAIVVTVVLIVAGAIVAAVSLFGININ